MNRDDYFIYMDKVRVVDKVKLLDKILELEKRIEELELKK